MKLSRFVFIIALLVGLVGCSPPTNSPFELIEASLDSLEKVTDISLSNVKTISALEGDHLVLRFNQPLRTGSESSLPVGATLISSDTLWIELSQANSVIIIPQSIKSASGMTLSREHTFNFSFPQTAEVPWNDYRSYLYMNGRKWYFDPLTMKEIIVPGQGTVFINIGGVPYQREVYPGVGAITVTHKDEVYRYPVKYLPELGFDPVLRLSLTDFSSIGMDMGCIFPVMQEESLTLSLIWPFLKDDVETKIRSELGTKLKALEWVSGQECRLVVGGSPGETVDLGIGALADIYGYTHESDPYMESYSTHFTLSFHAFPTIVRLDPVSGEELRTSIPLYFDGATKWDHVKKQVHLFRYYRCDSQVGEYDVQEQFVYDIEQGCLIGQVERGTKDFPPAHRTAWFLVRDKGPMEGVISHLGFSPSGNKAAGLFRLPAGNKMVVYDTTSNTTSTHDLTSCSSNDGGGPPPETMYWSGDESLIIYRPWDEKNSPGIYALNIETGKEMKVFDGVGIINSVSPFGERVIVTSYVGQADGWSGLNTLVDFSGGKRIIANLQQAIGVTKWIDSERFLAVRFGKDLGVSIDSIIFDLTNDSIHPLGLGEAFDVDAETGAVYLVVRP